MPYKHFLGYERGEDGIPRIVESEAVIVRRIYQMFLEGATPTTIAKALTNDGIPTPTGKITAWQNTTVESILQNEKYKGDALLQKPEVYAEKYNALVKRHETAKSKYDALQENLSERAAKRGRIEIYLKELSRAENLVTAFDDGLWNTMVDTLTIYSKERIVFRFRDGSEVEWSIR